LIAATFNISRLKGRTIHEMYQIRIYTLRDGTKRKIKIAEGMTFQEELKKLGITESDIFQMQLVIHDDKM